MDSTAAAQWPQDIVVKPMEEIIATCPKPTERKIRPQKEHALNCPRCNSTNTKFCYYNNYSLSQPRYFCKTCRRYWTEGGSLRNIPVGGGSRKNKRSSSSTSNSTTPSKKLPDLIPQQNPNSKTLENPREDLNLGFSGSHHMIHMPAFDATNLELQNPSTSSSSSNLDLLTTTTSSRGLNAFMPLMTDLNYSSGFTFNIHPLGGADQFKPSLNFSLDGLGSNFGNFQGVQEQNGKVLFPFEDLKRVNNESEHGEENRVENNQNGDSTGYWPW